MDEIAEKSGAFIGRGITTTPVDMKKKYMFTPSVKKDDTILGGSILGAVEETPLLTHRILVPPNYPEATITEIAKEGEYDLEHIVGHALAERDKMTKSIKWPLESTSNLKDRSYSSPDSCSELLTLLFPIAKWTGRYSRDSDG